MGAKYGPEQDCADDQWQRDKNEKTPAISNMLMFAAHDRVNHSANRPHNNLTQHGRADAELLQMIVAADAAQDPNERLWRDENTESILEDDTGRGNIDCQCKNYH